MRILSFLSIALLSYAITWAQATATSSVPKRSDPEQLIALILANNATSPMYGEGFVRTSLNRMGDKAALGVFQYLGGRQMTVAEDSTSSQEVRMILYIIRTAFAEPRIIESEENRTPKATMVLLKYLGTLPAGSAVRDDLERTTKFVEQIRLPAAAH